MVSDFTRPGCRVGEDQGGRRTDLRGGSVLYRPASPAELANADAFLKAFPPSIERSICNARSCCTALRQTKRYGTRSNKLSACCRRNEQCLNLLHAAATRTGGTRYPLASGLLLPMPVPDPDDRVYTAAKLWHWRRAFGNPTGTGAVRGIRFRRCSYSRVLSIMNRTLRPMARETLVNNSHRICLPACCLVAT